MMITVVDRIGKEHNIDDKIYAYYDTYKAEYIVLDKYKEAPTPTIYGFWDGTSITVDGATGTSEEHILGSSVPVSNKINFIKPECPVRAVAVKFNSYVPGGH